MSNKGITIHLKTKKLKSGKLSYFLHSYHPLSGKRHKEYLGLYLIDKARSPADRKHNAETKNLAESIHAKKLLEAQTNHHGFKSKEKQIITFYSFYKKMRRK